jgi:heme/copper-type cytochrome/quinol oxidase subunit 2
MSDGFRNSTFLDCFCYFPRPKARLSKNGGALRGVERVFKKANILQSIGVVRLAGVELPASYSHTKWAWRGWAKRVICAICILGNVGLAGCRRTPTYSGPPDHVVHVTMKNWAILPGTIVLPRGAKVELIVESVDVEHGIAVPGLGINEPVKPGKPQIVRFLAEEPADYFMRCSISCGRGHDQMVGKIIVQ